MRGVGAKAPLLYLLYPSILLFFLPSFFPFFFPSFLSDLVLSPPLPATQTLALGQYREAFMDAAVDGAFLYDLDEDDLKNTLGIEHRLHRKKIIGE